MYKVVHRRMSCGHSSGFAQIVCALGPQRTITREGIAFLSLSAVQGAL